MTFDVVLAKIPRWGEVSILIPVEAGTCSEMMAFRSCSSTCFQGRSESSVSDGGRTGQTCTRIAQMLQTTSSHHDCHRKKHGSIKICPAFLKSL